MGFLILEPTSSPVAVPGTAFLEEQEERIHDIYDKHAPGRPDLVLVPTPSDDPNDPLNWSWARKEACFMCLLLSSVLAGTCGPLLAPAFVQLSGELNQPLNRVTLLSGVLVLTIGIGSLFFAAIQQKWGARPSFLIACVTQTISMLWAGGSKTNFPSLLAARVVQGLSMGCFFNNVPAAINAIFFVHQRGVRMSLWNLALIGGINIGPVISAQIISKQGWTYVFWWQGLVSGVVLIATYAFVPETSYDRRYYVAVIAARRARGEQHDVGSLDDKEKVDASSLTVEVPQEVRHSRYALFTGSKSDEAFLRIAIRPFYHMFSPVVIWGALTFSVVFNLLPLISVVYAQLFSAPPYNMSTNAIGLVSGFPALIGTVIGTVLSGPFSDWSVKVMAKRNNGVFEPEFRLVLMLAFLIFGGMGLYGWGLQESSSWVVPSIFIAILHVGVSAGTISCIAYVTDCTGEDSSDAIALVVFVKSVIGFGIIFIMSDWLAARGTRQFMVSLGSLAVASCSLALPAWIFGKKARYWYSTTRLSR